MKTEKENVLIIEPDGFPGFRQGNQKFCLLNLTLEVEIGGVTYHLRSAFSERSELGNVLDAIELERSQRQTA